MTTLHNYDIIYVLPFINDMEEFSYQIQEIFGGIKNEQLSERRTTRWPPCRKFRVSSQKWNAKNL